jgi:hypothetical protein
MIMMNLPYDASKDHAECRLCVYSHQLLRRADMTEAKDGPILMTQNHMPMGN